MSKVVRELKDLATYRGGEGHWSYILHRVTGVGVLLFLVVHILDTALVGWGPDLYNRVMKLYSHPFFRVNEVFLFAAVLYHSLNGLRIVIIDFWPGSTKHHRRLFWIETILFFAAMIPVAVWMLLPIFRKGAH